MTYFFHVAIDCSERTAVFAGFPTLTGQIGIAHPVTGTMIFLMEPEWEAAPRGINAKPWGTLVFRCAAHLYVSSSPIFSVKLELFASSNSENQNEERLLFRLIMSFQSGFGNLLFSSACFFFSSG